jgi:two-component system chemotaxis sensor kinase CheA
MTTMDMSKYKDLFISEAREHIQGMSDCILILEKDPGSEQGINELFRHAHSVKGMAASMGYSSISELSHRLEDMMDTVRRGQTRISSAIIDLLLEGTDALESLVDAVEQDTGTDNIDTSALISKIRSVIEGNIPVDKSREPEQQETAPADTQPVEQKSTAAPKKTTRDKRDLLVHFNIAGDSIVPAARAYLAVKKLESLGEVRSIDPPLNQIKAGDYPGKVSLVIGGVEADTVRKTLESLAEMGEVSLTDPEHETTDAQPPSGEPSEPPVESGTPKRSQPSTAQAAKTVRISTALLDTFINLVGELIVTKGRLNDLMTGSGSRVVDEVLTRLDHLVSGLHGEVMKVRMMPLETVTQRLPRVVRDLARQRGKTVSLEIVGADIELDRAILEELGDPLIHILRNAVDHGLEETKERSAANKKETGRIVLRAFRERDMVHVQIMDDGRGMDLDRIRAKAVEKNLISREQAKVISDEETVMLVCRPGFSTAAEVTDVSGRGVGMDVVQSTVEGLGGSVSIESSTGEGTTFTLRLPLTVAIVKMLLVALVDHLFAIPITRVARTIRVPHDELSESQGRHFLSLDEELITLFDLGELLRIEKRMNGRELHNVVLVEATNRTVGLVVDGVVGQVDIVVKPLCYPIQYLKRYSGMTVLGDGRIVPILDLGNLF